MPIRINVCPECRQKSLEVEEDHDAIIVACPCGYTDVALTG